MTHFRYFLLKSAVKIKRKTYFLALKAGFRQKGTAIY